MKHETKFTDCVCVDERVAENDLNLNLTYLWLWYEQSKNMLAYMYICEVYV